MKTVCVVGLGPAGLSVVKELKEAGLEVTGFDRSSRIGGRWSMDSTIKTGVWNGLCLNSTRRSTEYSCFEWKAEKYLGTAGVQEGYAGKFAHFTEFNAYLEDYVNHFDLMPSIQLETTVVKIDKTEGGGWSVTTESKSGTKNPVMEFDGLVVCSGRFIEARNPLLESSLKSFVGTIVHSKDFRSLHDYSGKRVLVVGSSISGGDISASLARTGKCAKVVNSVRHTPYVLDKVSPVSSLPLDEFMWQRLPVWLSRYIPASIVSKGLQSLILEQYPSQLTADELPNGMELDEDIRNAGITLSIGYVKAVKKGKLSLKPGIASSEGNKLTFEDGTTEEFDVIICCTGYQIDLSFLPTDVEEAVTYLAPYSGAKDVALYKHTLVPGIDNLAFAGVINTIGPTLFAFEMQARYIAAIWTGQLSRPSDMALEKGVAAIKAFRLAHPFNKASLCVEIAEDLGDEMGLTPSRFKALWNAKSLLTGPLHPVYYRTKPQVEGLEKSKASQALFDYYMSHPDKVEGEF